MTAIPSGEAARLRRARCAAPSHSFADLRRAWMPWVILAVCVFLWGTPQVRAALDGLWIAKIPVAGLHELVQKMPPVVAVAARRGRDLQHQHSVGDRQLAFSIAAIISGLFLGYGVRDLVRSYAANDLRRSLFAAHDLVHDGDRLRHPLFGQRCDARV